MYLNFGIYLDNNSLLIKPLLFLLFRLFRIKVHNNFAQADDVFAEDATVEGTDGPIDASAIRKRIYSGILEGKKQIIASIEYIVNHSREHSSIVATDKRLRLY